MSQENKGCLRIRNHFGRDIYGDDPRTLEVRSVSGVPDLARVFSRFFAGRDRIYGGIDSGDTRKDMAGDVTRFHFSLKEFGEAFLGTYEPSYFSEFIGRYLEEGEQEEAFLSHIRNFRRLFRSVIVGRPSLRPLFDLREFERFAPQKGIERDGSGNIYLCETDFSDNWPLIEGEIYWDILDRRNRVTTRYALLDLSIHGALKVRLRRFRRQMQENAFKAGVSNLVFCPNFPQLWDKRYAPDFWLSEEQLFLNQTRPTPKRPNSVEDIPHELFVKLVEEAKRGGEPRERLERAFSRIGRDALLEHILKL